MNFKFKIGEKVKIKFIFSEYDEFIAVIENRFYNQITDSNKYGLIIGDTILREVIDEKYLQLYELED